MNSHIDFRTMPSNVPVLCIPRVYPNINEMRIRRIFDDLNMGTLERIDIVSKVGEKGEKFNRVFIHFRKWNDSENACLSRERLLNGKEIKIIYDDPWFWKVSAYRETERKPVHSAINSSRKATIQFEPDEQQPNTRRPVEQNIRRPVEQNIRRPVEQNTRRPVEQNTRRPVEQSNRRPVEQPSRRPVEQSNRRPVEQSNRRPVEQRRCRDDSADNPNGNFVTMVYDLPDIDYGNIAIPIKKRNASSAKGISKPVEEAKGEGEAKEEEGEAKEEGEEKANI